MKWAWKIVVALLSLAILLTLGIGLLSGWSMGAHGADITALSTLTNGMTMGQTRDILGEPSETRPQENGSTIWFYGQPLKWCNVLVRFNSNNLVESTEHDH